jgi:hypothetical protein
MKDHEFGRVQRLAEERGYTLTKNSHLFPDGRRNHHYRKRYTLRRDQYLPVGTAMPLHEVEAFLRR